VEDEFLNMTAQNPLIPQFWLFGVDAERGDLMARGFRRLDRPDGASTKSSLYALNGVLLQANGAWLEAAALVYHRGTERFYQSTAPYFRPQAPDHLEPVPFQTGLETIRPAILAHECWMFEYRGSREVLLEQSPPFGVRQTWRVWRNWLLS
jgi:hypothetical protein